MKDMDVRRWTVVVGSPGRASSRFYVDAKTDVEAEGIALRTAAEELGREDFFVDREYETLLAADYFAELRGENPTNPYGTIEADAAEARNLDANE